MSIFNSLKQSIIVSFILKIKIYADNSFLFNISLKNNIKPTVNTYRTWMENSLFYSLCKKINSYLMKIEGKILDSLQSSILISSIFKNLDKLDNKEKSTDTMLRNSFIYKLFIYLKANYSLSNLLIFIPTAYVVIDYAIRKVGILTPIASVWDELTLMLIVAYIVMRGIFSGGSIGYKFTPMDLPIIIYFIIGLCHVLIKSPDMGVAIEGFRSVFQHILWYFIATQLVKSIEDSEKVIALMSTIGLFLGIHSVYQYVAKVPMPGNWVDTAENITTRAFSIIGSPNILGAIFVLFIPIVFSFALVKKDKIRMRLYYFISSIFMLAGLLLTMSRGAWLAFAFAAFIFIIALKPRLIILFSGLVATFILYGGALSERLLYMLSPIYLMKSAAGGRLYRWEIGLDYWSRSKLFGLGLGRFGGAVAMNNELAPFYLDNYYLKTLTEMGIFGIAALAFVIICFIVFSIRIIRSQKQIEARVITIGLFSGCLGVLAHNFVENIFEVPAMVTYFWIGVALINTFAPKVDSHKL